MLKIIRTLLKDKKEKLYLPIFLMVIDSIGSIVLYLMLYFTVVSIYGNMFHQYDCKDTDL